MRRAICNLATRVYLALHRPFLRRRVTPFSRILREPIGIILRLPTAPGELLFATPTLRVIRRVFDNSKIFLLVSEERKTLLQENPHFNGITLDDERILPLTPSFFRWKRHLRRQKFDLFIDLCRNNQNRGRLLSLLTGAKVRIGREAGEPFFNCEIFDEEKHQDEVDKHLHLISPFLGDYSKREKKLSLFLSSKRQKAAKDFLRYQGVKRHETLIGIDLQWWNPPSLLQLLKEMEDRYFPRILLMDTLKNLHPEEISEGLKNDPIHLPPHLKLECPELINECHLFLSFKTDLFSISYALEIPTILFLRQEDDVSFTPPARETFKTITLEKREEFPLTAVLENIHKLILS